jgi:hypothetical protein
MPDQRSLLLLFVVVLDCCASSLAMSILYFWLELVIVLALEWELLMAVKRLLVARLSRDDRVDWPHCCNVLVREGSRKRCRESLPPRANCENDSNLRAAICEQSI